MPRASPGDCVSPRVGCVLSGMKSSLYIVCAYQLVKSAQHTGIPREAKERSEQWWPYFPFKRPPSPQPWRNRREQRAAGAGRRAGRDAQRLAGPDPEIATGRAEDKSRARAPGRRQIRSPPARPCAQSRIPVAASWFSAPGGPGAPISARRRGGDPGAPPASGEWEASAGRGTHGQGQPGARNPADSGLGGGQSRSQGAGGGGVAKQQRAFANPPSPSPLPPLPALRSPAGARAGRGCGGGARPPASPRPAPPPRPRGKEGRRAAPACSSAARPASSRVPRGDPDSPPEAAAAAGCTRPRRRRARRARACGAAAGRAASAGTPPRAAEEAPGGGGGGEGGGGGLRRPRDPLGASASPPPPQLFFRPLLSHSRPAPRLCARRWCSPAGARRRRRWTLVSRPRAASPPLEERPPSARRLPRLPAAGEASARPAPWGEGRAGRGPAGHCAAEPRPRSPGTPPSVSRPGASPRVSALFLPLPLCPFSFLFLSCNPPQPLFLEGGSSFRRPPIFPQMLLFRPGFPFVNLICSWLSPAPRRGQPNLGDGEGFENRSVYVAGKQVFFRLDVKISRSFITELSCLIKKGRKVWKIWNFCGE